MKRKIRLTAMAAALVMLIAAAMPVYADTIIDYVLYTDIRTYIDGVEISSYNINGYTAVVVEDLANYGFDVVWNGSARTLTAKRAIGKAVTGSAVSSTSGGKVGDRAMPVYATDIKTYFDGVEFKSYNVGGKTIVYVDDLAKQYSNNYNWNSFERILSMTLSGEINESNQAASSSAAYGSIEKYEITDTYFDYYKNSIGSIQYFGIVEITNTGNTNLYLKDCVFELEDNFGHLLQSNRYISQAPYIIKPGEKGYFFDDDYIEDDVNISNGINFVPRVTVIKTTGDPEDYEIWDTSIGSGNYDNIIVKGRIKNNTEEDDSIYVCVLLYDSWGHVIGADTTSVYNLYPGQTTSFEINTWLDISENVTLGMVSNYKVFAYTYYYQYK